MAPKRPYDDEVVIQASSKHQKQDEPHVENTPYGDDFCKEDLRELHDSGEVSIRKSEVAFHDNLENGSDSEVLKEVVEESESDALRYASLSHWATSISSDHDEAPKEIVHLPFYTGYFSLDHPVRPEIKPDDSYYCLSEYSPRKQVPIGPDHQAEIPAWGDSMFDGYDCLHLGGICILPNPEIQLGSSSSEKVGNDWIGCRCLDQGSVTCIRKHIAEARDKLSRTLGLNIFMELGFFDMGEVVSEKWSNEEEQLFHEVVYANPASLGKNFWNALSAVFPTRTKMEIVSYYFNVFMLRKRAAQNRCDPISVDSDNDEWEAIDDTGADEGRESVDDEDSGIESPARHDDIKFHHNGIHVHEHEEDDGNVSNEALETDENNSRGLIQRSDSDTGFELIAKKADDVGENDVQDGSCTSSDSGASPPGTQMRNDVTHEWHEYILDSADGKAWDGYMSCSKSNIDLLPTCRMIEEVFGDGDFISNDDNRW